MNKTLIVFARKPIIGKVKKRLAEKIETKNALNAYIKLLDITTKVAACVKASVKFYWSELEKDEAGLKQQGRDLGARMYNAFTNELKDDSAVCLIGSDTPYITKQIIESAFKALHTADIVFGPAKDGGYYLVAIKASPPKELFLQRRWSHSEVLKEALEVCRQHDLKVHLTQTLLDIDTKEDYDIWMNSENDSQT